MKRGNEGFTLLEVLVTLTILAVVSAGLIGGMGESARQRERIETVTFAHWVAANRLAELRAAHVWSEPGVAEDTVSLVGRAWKLHVRVSATSRPDMRKAEVLVSNADGEVTSLTGFLGKY